MSLGNAGRRVVKNGLKVVSETLFQSSRNLATKAAKANPQATINASFSADATKSTYKAYFKVRNLSGAQVVNVVKTTSTALVAITGFVTSGLVAREYFKHLGKVAELKSEVQHLKHEAKITKDLDEQIHQKDVHIAKLEKRTVFDIFLGKEV